MNLQGVLKVAGPCVCVAFVRRVLRTRAGERSTLWHVLQTLLIPNCDITLSRAWFLEGIFQTERMRSCLAEQPRAAASWQLTRHVFVKASCTEASQLQAWVPYYCGRKKTHTKLCMKAVSVSIRAKGTLGPLFASTCGHEQVSCLYRQNHPCCPHVNPIYPSFRPPLRPLLPSSLFPRSARHHIFSPRGLPRLHTSVPRDRQRPLAPTKFVYRCCISLFRHVSAFV